MKLFEKQSYCLVLVTASVVPSPCFISQNSLSNKSPIYEVIQTEDATNCIKKYVIKFYFEHCIQPQYVETSVS